MFLFPHAVKSTHWAALKTSSCFTLVKMKAFLIMHDQGFWYWHVSRNKTCLYRYRENRILYRQQNVSLSKTSGWALDFSTSHVLSGLWLDLHWCNTKSCQNLRHVFAKQRNRLFIAREKIFRSLVQIRKKAAHLPMSRNDAKWSKFTETKHLLQQQCSFKMYLLYTDISDKSLFHVWSPQSLEKHS